jgi:rhodanese-related sulfurtransferase
MKKPLIQAVILIVASFVIAITANALASRERKVALVGWYPNATKVTARSESAQPAASSSQAPVAAPAPATITTPVATQTLAPIPVPQPSNPVTQTTPTTTTPQPRNPATAQPTPQPAPPPPPDVLSRFTPHPDKAYVEIGYDDVAALHGKGVLFLDARRTSVYEQGHIAGARPFSVWEADIDDKTRKLFDERSDPAAQALPIVIYCSGGDCEDSHMLAEKLWGIQFNNVYVYKDGYPDWQKRGGAVRTGAQP